ncbi:MAG: metal-binding protein [Cellvibrionales bacterium]|nr:MAG: metal-binding protein [Cellvibrionales bacterium]
MNYRYCLVGVLLSLSLAACSEQSKDQPLAQAPTRVAGDQAAEQRGVAQSSPAIAMDLYKSPSCGCCGKWAEHAEDRGFSLTTYHPADLNKVKLERGIAASYQSCHTAVSTEGFVFEGHIPARIIQQFLAAPPADSIGLAVPGMPAGSPGMEMGDRFTPYQVLLLKRDGGASVFAEVNTPLEQY